MSRTFTAIPGKGIVCNTHDDTDSVLNIENCKIYPDNIKNAEGVLIDNGVDESDVHDVLQAIGYVLLNEELYPSSDESTITSSTNAVDLSSAISTGKSCISELRKIYPDIPVNCKYRRSRSWSDHWYVTFYLMLPVMDLAKDYRDEVSPDDKTDYEPYWDYLHDFMEKCNDICKRPEFTNDETQCAVEYFNDASGPSGAVLRVFDLTT